MRSPQGLHKDLHVVQEDLWGSVNYRIFGIIISVFDGQIFGYKQLPLNIKIGDLCKNW